MAVRLIEARLPDFGMPTERPELPQALYGRRFDAFRAAVEAAGYDAAVIYADREHCANLAYLTGFDPRFEEALLVIVPGRTPTLFAGPENLGRAAASAIEVEAKLYPPFGLMGQDRRETPPLVDILRAAGIASGQKLGVLGWKYYGPHETATPNTWLETPSFIVDALRTITGGVGRVANANALMMQSSTGLRAVNEIEQIAQFEFSAVAASEAIKNLVRSLRPGLREFEAVQKMLGVSATSARTLLRCRWRMASSEPVSTARPSRMIVTRCASRSTSLKMWLESSTVAPPAVCSATHSLKTCSISGSRPEVGSSRISSSDGVAKAATRATF